MANKKLVRFDWAMKKMLRHKANFKGIHKHDILTLADKQIELYKKINVHEIFPEFWVIKVGEFGNRVKDKLDEWIYFFKNGEIKADFSAKGLKEASERLDEMKLNEKDAKEYKRYLKELRDIASEQHTKMADAQDLLIAEKKGEENKEIEAFLGLHENGVPVSIIAKSLKISEEKVLQIIRS